MVTSGKFAAASIRVGKITASGAHRGQELYRNHSQRSRVIAVPDDPYR